MNDCLVEAAFGATLARRGARSAPSLVETRYSAGRPYSSRRHSHSIGPWLKRKSHRWAKTTSDIQIASANSSFWAGPTLPNRRKPQWYARPVAIRDSDRYTVSDIRPALATGPLTHAGRRSASVANSAR